MKIRKLLVSAIVVSILVAGFVLNGHASHQNTLDILWIADPHPYQGRICEPPRAKGCTRTEHRQAYSIEYIVIHATTSPQTQTDINTFLNDPNKSTHYLISNGKGPGGYKEGQIIQMVKDEDTAWTVGVWPVNSVGTRRGPIHHFNTINIEIVGDATQPGWITQSMYETTAKLTRALADHYGLSKKRQKDGGSILGHYEVAPKDADPCKTGVDESTCNFDWNRFMQLVRGKLEPENDLKRYDINNNNRIDSSEFWSIFWDWLIGKASNDTLTKAYRNWTSQEPIDLGQLLIDGSRSSSGRQLGHEFHFQGTGFEPNTTVNRHITGPTGVFDFPIETDSSGALEWDFTPDCGELPGTYEITITDKRDPSQELSNTVTQIVDPSARCPADKYPNYPAPAPIVQLGTYSDTLSQLDDDDYLALYLSRGEPITLLLTHTSGADFDLYLYRPNDYATAWIFSQRDDKDVEMTVKRFAPQSGKYLIRVRNRAGATRGSWTLQIKKSTPTPPPVTRHTMAKEVREADPSKPINETTRFFTTDSRAVVWYELTGGEGYHNSYAEWYSPAGDLYRRSSIAVAKQESWNKWFVWHWIWIKGYEAQNLLGTWRVEVYVDDQFQFREFFVIQKPTGSLSLERLLQLKSVALRTSLVKRTTTFLVQGEGINSIRVDVYALDGTLIYTQQAAGTRLDWHWQTSRGTPVANGVYLYQVTVKGQNASIRTPIKKLLVLR